MKIFKKKLFRKKPFWYEKWYEKNIEEAKKDYVTISRLELLDAFSRVMTDVKASTEESHSLAIFGAMVVEEIFNKDKGKNEKTDD